MVKGRRIELLQHFDGLPKLADFKLVEDELPALKDGDILFRSLFISVDPYQRFYSDSFPAPMTMPGSSVALVEESKNKNYPKGTGIVVYGGWVERAVINPDNVPKVLNMPGVYKIPDVGGLSPSHMLGALGMPGLVAYFGLLHICMPKEGQTVVVSGAAGAVGSVVGQIAKIKGCTVIGFAGTDEKVAWLKEVGYDYAFNYKKTTIEDALKEAAPKGVDCYFDNVGGKMSFSVLQNMNSRGRTAVCGSISHYNSLDQKAGNSQDVLPLCLFKELMIEGFLLYRFEEHIDQAITELAGWMKEGRLVARETIVDGFENTPKAFIGLFDGSNTGKMVVKV